MSTLALLSCEEPLIKAHVTVYRTTMQLCVIAVENEEEVDPELGYLAHEEPKMPACYLRRSSKC